MGAMIADPELLPDHLYHPRRSPDGSSKAERFGSFCQQGRQLRHLLCTQSRLGPRRWLVPQGLHSLGLRLLEPLAHCPFTHPKCGGDVFLFPSRFMQFPGAHPSCFAPICWWCRFLAHTSFHRQFVLVLYFFLFRSIKKGQKRWLWTAMCRRTRQIVAFVIGDRSKATCLRLWTAIPDAYKHCHTFSDFWRAYREVFPAETHRCVGKETGETAHMERWNNTALATCWSLCTTDPLLFQG